GGERLVLAAHDLLRRRALRRQLVVQPVQRRYDGRILIAQPLNQLNCEALRQRAAIEAGEGGRSLGCPAAAETQEGMGERVGALPVQAGTDDALREAAEILYQHDA